MNSFKTCTILHIAQQIFNRYPPFINRIEKTHNSTPFFHNSKRVGIDWYQAVANPSFMDPVHQKWLHIIAATKATQIHLAQTIHDHFNLLDRAGASYYTLSEASFYSSLLMEIKNPPLALSALGALPQSEDLSISVVGSRKASFRSLNIARKIGYRLSQKHFRVVSGGAYGCDISAHIGCLENDEWNIQTTIVFAGGLGFLYPKGNLNTFRELIKSQGTFISEKLWFHRPKPRDFPIRNRIISGLSPKTILIHASKKSGAMQTCKLALDQGRDVLVLAPPSQCSTMEGNSELILEGAPSFYNTDQLESLL